MVYRPPFEITNKILSLVASICENLGELHISSDMKNNPRLRKDNRIKSIHASLAIENNTLTLEQVTALIDGKRVLGPPKDIREVRNAFEAYEILPSLQPDSEKDMLKVHGFLTKDLVDRSGHFRKGGVCVAGNEGIVHIAPPADRVPSLMDDLFEWYKSEKDIHPLIKSCVFHYEMEFIHPFEDGNGRMGRFWQTLILSKWNPMLAWVPIETVIRENQQEYYDVLERCDERGDSTEFIEFILQSLKKAIEGYTQTAQVTTQVTAQVISFLKCFGSTPTTAINLMEKMKLSNRHSFRDVYLKPCLSDGLISMTIPDKPNSRNQQYYITEKGKEIIQKDQ